MIRWSHRDAVTVPAPLSFDIDLAYVQNTYNNPYMNRTAMARLEVRVPESDLLTWQHAADRRGETLSDFVRSAASVTAAPSSFHLLLQRVRALIVEHERKGGTSDSAVLHLTFDEEHQLLMASARDVGDRMGILVTEGPRTAFPKLFGYQVKFRSSQFRLGPA